MVGRRLNQAEIAAYDVAPADVSERVRVIRIPFLPGNYVGMTLGRLVLLATDVAEDGSSRLMAHELVHVRQWSERGLIGFSAWYLRSFLGNLLRLRRWRRAYLAVEAEVQARKETSDWHQRRTGTPNIF